MNIDLGIFQVITDLGPIQAFAHDHPIYYAVGAFMAGSSLPKLWTSFVTSWLPNATIKTIKFLRARGMTTAQLKELDRAIEVIDKEIDAEVAKDKAEQAGEKKP
mgnify:FL=1